MNNKSNTGENNDDNEDFNQTCNISIEVPLINKKLSDKIVTIDGALTKTTVDHEEPNGQVHEIYFRVGEIVILLFFFTTRVYFSYDFFWPSGGMCNLAGIGAKNLKFCEPRSRDSLVFDQ